MYKPIILNGNETNYMIDEDGNIKGKFGKILKHNISTKGYHMVKLYLDEDTKFNASVHRLVAEAFIPNPENKPEVNHIDGDKNNNHISNLEWVTGSENIIHAFQHKLRVPKYGEENPRSIFDDELIHSICKLHTLGYSSRKIRKELNIKNKYIINSVLRGKTRTPLTSQYGIVPHKKKNKSNSSTTNESEFIDGCYVITINAPPE